MNLLANRLIEAMVLPPGSLLLLMLLGLLFWRSVLGRLLLWLGLSATFLLSLPAVAGVLMSSLEVFPALDEEALRASDAQAIVVLGGGRYTDAPEYGGDTVNSRLLHRLRYAAWLQRKTGLAIIPSGGSPIEDGDTEAELARGVLESEFQARVGLIEDRSRTTWENAHFLKPLLEQAGIRHVLLVTDAWHLPRALYAFRRAGIKATPAPTYFIHKPDDEWAVTDWVPNFNAARNSGYALHEYLGMIWYQMK